MTDRISTDILISGGGIAGLTAACAFGAAGYDVICVDPTPPVTVSDDAQTDLRSTAFLQPARATLARAGLWDQLAPFAAPLQIMRLADAGGTEPVIREVADFDAAEISDEPFGWNLPNWLLRRELLARLKNIPSVTFRPGVGVARLITRTEAVLVNLTDETQVSAQLLIGADGRNSTVRKAVGIDVKTWDYQQKALVFVVETERPHENVSTEIHRTGGPFTVVPMPDQNGAHFVSVVWMETAQNADTLMALDEDAFHAALQTRSCDILGTLTLRSARKIWPIISQKSTHLIAERTALIAEAAHVIPPIGAQGLNMSLADIDALLSLTEQHEIGSRAHLTAYETARANDIALRIRGVDALNRAAIAQSDTLRSMRLAGLRSLHGLAPIRKALMKKGLG